jgi:hypothetical protein
MRRRAWLPVLLATALLALPSAAAADDEYEIDERLAAAGFDDAYTDYLRVDTSDGEAVHVVLDYDSAAAGLEEYDREAQEAAETIWEHLELRVATVVVAPVEGVSWRDGSSPPARAFSRPELEQSFGARSAGLDDDGAGFYGSSGDVFTGIFVLVIALALIGGGLLGGFFWGRAVGRRGAQRDAWSGAPPSSYGGPPWQQPPSAWPPAQQPGWPPPSDPWRSS